MASRLMKKKTSPALRALKVFYIILVIISILIVGLFVAYQSLIKPPDVAEQITFPIKSSAPVSSGNPAVSPAPDDPDDPEATPSDDVIVYTRQQGVYTCLLLGVADMGGSDTIMLGCFDTNNKTASLISIPRDTLVLYDGKNSKINAVYSKGKEEAMVAMVSEMLGVPIDYYMSVNLKAFAAIVDTIGGVKFNVPVDMNYDDPTQDLHIHINAGYQTLTSAQAVGVMRCRSCYANADYGRVETQRAFLAALVSQTITISNVTNVTKLINILSSYVVTDMPLDKMIYFATSAIGMDLDTDLQSATLPSDWINPYVEINDDEALDLLNELLPVYTEPIVADIVNFRHK